MNRRDETRERARSVGLWAKLVFRDHGAGSRTAGRWSTISTSTSASSARGLAGLTTAHETRPARLVGRRAGEPAASPGTPRGAIAASFCRDLRWRWTRSIEPCRARPRQGAVVAVRDGPRLCARDHPRDAHAGRRAGRWLAQGLQGRQDRGGDRRPQALRPGCSARRSRAGPPSACATCCDSRHYFHAMHFPRAFHMHPLNYALGLAAAAEAAGRAHLRRHAARSRSIPMACASASTTPKARVRASHIVLACNVHLGALMPRAAGTLLPIWTY